MKKLFLAFTAFAGMLTGLSLTACSGGGSGDNLSGTVLFMQASNAYKIIINEQVDGLKTVYSADITDSVERYYTKAILSFTNVEMSNGKLKHATGNLAPESFNEPDFPNVLVWMFGTVGDVNANRVSFVGDAEGVFEINVGDNDKVTIDWTFSSIPYWQEGSNENSEKYALIPLKKNDGSGDGSGEGEDDDEDDDNDDEVKGDDYAQHHGKLLRY